ncbi:ABC transporter permease [Alphaproteobacteria bacterium]|nr:ABC transporter permease [Alphaproteobacteria bacterium]
MKDFLNRYARSKSALFGLGFLTMILFAAAFADLLAPTDPWASTGERFVKPFSEGALFGTDSLGRDIWAGVVHGTRVSLLVGFSSAFLSLLIGVFIGHIAGYLGNWASDILMHLTEIVQTIPAFILAVIIVALLQPSIPSIIAAVSIVSWPPTARLVRGEVLALKSREFIEAARLSGLSRRAIMLREVLPNCASPIIVMGSLTVASAILMESAIGFLGLGDPNLMSWGYMVGSARSMLRIAWWMCFFPGGAIFLTVLSINLASEGLSDALDPKFSPRRGGEGQRESPP